MNNVSNHIELVELYAQGKLEGDALLAFEAQLRTNTELNSLVMREKAIAQAAVIVRKQQIKAAVAKAHKKAVLGQQLTFALIGILAVLGTVSGFLFYRHNVQPTDANYNLQSTVYQPASPKSEPVNKISEPLTVAKPSGTAKVKQNLVRRNRYNATTDLQVKSTPQVQTPVFSEVFVAEPDNSEFFDDVTTPEPSPKGSYLSPSNNTTESEDMPEIVVEKSLRKKQMYKFTEGRLYLQGDFSSVYEIIDLKTAAGHNFFLYYNKEFYALDPNKSKLTPLKRVTNKDLQRQLNMVLNL